MGVLGVTCGVQSAYRRGATTSPGPVPRSESDRSRGSSGRGTKVVGGVTEGISGRCEHEWTWVQRKCCPLQWLASIFSRSARSDVKSKVSDETRRPQGDVVGMTRDEVLRSEGDIGMYVGGQSTS